MVTAACGWAARKRTGVLEWLDLALAAAQQPGGRRRTMICPTPGHLEYSATIPAAMICVDRFRALHTARAQKHLANQMLEGRDGRNSHLHALQPGR